MAIYFMVKDNIVINVITIENSAEYTPPYGCELVEWTGQRGWLNSVYIDGKFVDPPPFPSWILDGYDWIPPVPKPTDGQEYNWDEDTLTWIVVIPLANNTPITGGNESGKIA